jgi:hypothetical protein
VGLCLLGVAGGTLLLAERAWLSGPIAPGLACVLAAALALAGRLATPGSSANRPTARRS